MPLRDLGLERQSWPWLLEKLEMSLLKGKAAVMAREEFVSRVEESEEQSTMRKCYKAKDLIRQSVHVL